MVKHRIKSYSKFQSYLCETNSVLKGKFPQQQSEEQGAFGISLGISEVDECLEDIKERFKEKDKYQKKGE